MRLIKDWVDGGFDVAAGELVVLENCRINKGEKKNVEETAQPELINDILHYYNNQNEMLNSFTQWDTNYVKDQVVEYYLSHHTGNLRRYFEQNVLHDGPRQDDAMMMRQMLDDPDFQSLQAYNYIIKMNYLGQLQEAREEAIKLLSKIQKYLPTAD